MLTACTFVKSNVKNGNLDILKKNGVVIRDITYTPTGLPDYEVDRNNFKNYGYYEDQTLESISYSVGTNTTELKYNYDDINQLKSIVKDGTW